MAIRQIDQLTMEGIPSPGAASAARIREFCSRAGADRPLPREFKQDKVRKGMRYDEIRTQLQNSPMTRYQVLVVGIAMLVHMADGFDLLAISFAGPAIDREWTLGPERLGELFSAGLIGMAFGAFGLSWLADIYGRRTATLINLTVITIGMTCSS